MSKGGDPTTGGTRIRLTGLETKVGAEAPTRRYAEAAGQGVCTVSPTEMGRTLLRTMP
jgi:hypothetical protein